MELSTYAEDKTATMVGERGYNTTIIPEKAGTVYDQQDMARVGKAQELRVSMP